MSTTAETVVMAVTDTIHMKGGHNMDSIIITKAGSMVIGREDITMVTQASLTIEDLMMVIIIIAVEQVIVILVAIDQSLHTYTVVLFARDNLRLHLGLLQLH